MLKSIKKDRDTLMSLERALPSYMPLAGDELERVYVIASMSVQHHGKALCLAF